MPSHYTHGPDYLDKDKKKKFSYKKEKAKLDSRMSNYHKEMERLKQERVKKEATKKIENKAKKLAEEADKKRSRGISLRHEYKLKDKKAVLKKESKAVKKKK